VRASDRPGEQRITREQMAVDLERDAARAVARCVQDLELERAGAIGLTFDQGGHVVDARRDRTELPTERTALRNDVLFRCVDRDRDRTKRSPQLRTAGDVVDVACD